MNLDERRVPRAAVVVAVFLFSLPAFAAKKTWVNAALGGGFGRWENPTNWSPFGVPTESDDVYIGDRGACKLADGAIYEVRSLHVQKGGSLEITDSQLWWWQTTESSIDKGGAVVLRSGAVLQVAELSQSSLSIAGTIDLKGGSIDGGSSASSVTIQKSGVLNVSGENEIGVILTNRGTIDLRDDAYLAGGNWGFISNVGTITKSGNGTASLEVGIGNTPDGEVDAGTGTLAMPQSAKFAGTYRGKIEEIGRASCRERV